MNVSALLDHLTTQTAAMEAVIREIVGHETPSGDKAALDALANILADRYAALGAVVETIPNETAGVHVVARLAAGAGTDERPALVLCHFDTVWPIGTLDLRPVREEDGRLHGPGIFDMKSSIVMLEYALRAIQATGAALPRPITVLLTSDEEVGSLTSRALIEAEARASAYALVLESPLPGGRLKTARKGVGRYNIEIQGKAAHAGVEPEKGINAVQELAHQILHLHGLGDPAAGTTVNVGVVIAGTTPNVVPASASARVDVRVSTRAEAERIDAAMAGLTPVVLGARVTATGGFNRPPMERTPAVAELYERARAIGRTLGIELSEGSTGGGSDGNFTAALGLPTLDGLGVPGAGAHAEHEHIILAALAPRTALLAALLLGL